MKEWGAFPFIVMLVVTLFVAPVIGYNIARDNQREQKREEETYSVPFLVFPPSMLLKKEIEEDQRETFTYSLDAAGNRKKVCPGNRSFGYPQRWNDGWKVYCVHPVNKEKMEVFLTNVSLATYPGEMP